MRLVEVLYCNSDIMAPAEPTQQGLGTKLLGRAEVSAFDVSLGDTCPPIITVRLNLFLTCGCMSQAQSRNLVLCSLSSPISDELGVIQKKACVVYVRGECLCVNMLITLNCWAHFYV